MNEYNFWQDLFDTYQSLSDWPKILWLIVPPAFMLGLVALTLRFRIESRKADTGFGGELITPSTAMLIIAFTSSGMFPKRKKFRRC